MLWRIPEPVLFAALVAVLSATTGLGLFLGVRRGGVEDERSLTQLTTLQAAVLGLPALLLGFSFEMATTRTPRHARAATPRRGASSLACGS
jgi:hypothetical protein